MNVNGDECDEDVKHEGKSINTGERFEDSDYEPSYLDTDTETSEVELIPNHKQAKIDWGVTLNKVIRKFQILHPKIYMKTPNTLGPRSIFLNMYGGAGEPASVTFTKQGFMSSNTEYPFQTSANKFV